MAKTTKRKKQGGDGSAPATSTAPASSSSSSAPATSTTSAPPSGSYMRTASNDALVAIREKPDYSAAPVYYNPVEQLIKQQRKSQAQAMLAAAARGGVIRPADPNSPEALRAQADTLNAWRNQNFS